MQFERLAVGLRADRRQDPPPLRRQGAEDGGLRPVRRLAATREKGISLLLQDLLHVHRQAHHALQAQGARRPGLRLLHGHPRRRQGLRRVLAAGHRRGRRGLHPRPRQPHLPGGRQGHGHGASTRCRRAGRDRGRHGGAGHRRAPAGRRQGAGPEARHRLRRLRLHQRGPRQAAPGGDATPPASSWPAPARRRKTSRTRSPGERRRRQGDGPLQHGRAGARAGRRRGQRADLHRLHALQEGLPLRRHRGERDLRPRRQRLRHVAYVNPGVCRAAAPARPCA